MDFGSAHNESVRSWGDGGYPDAEAKDSFGDHSHDESRRVPLPGALSAVHGVSSGSDFMTAAHADRTSPSQVDRSMTLMDQKVSKVQQAEQSKLQMISEQTQRLVEGLQSMAVSREILDERKTKEIRMIENSIALDLNVLRQARKDGEAKSDKAMQSHIEDMRSELQKVRLMRESAFEDYSQEVGDEVQRLKDELEREGITRADRAEQIATSLDSELERVREAVASEQKIRFETEGAMLRMLEDMCVRMRGEIATERKEREQMQGTLLGLLEETCQRFEHSFDGRVPASSHQQPA